MRKVSVIMSVYNGEAYLKQAIESILNQTLKDFEFIIIDDASTDSSAKIIQSFGDERIKYIKNEQNLGLTKSLNKAIELSETPIIARMDADDISLPERLLKQVEYLNSHPNIELLGTWASMIDEKGKFIQTIKAPSKYEDILSEIFSQNPFIHSSVCFRKGLIEKLGNYNEDIKKSQDYDLWLKIILNKGMVENLPEVLIEYRSHEESISVKTSQNQQEYVNIILKKYLTEFTGRNISESTIKNLRQIKFFGKKLENPLAIIGVLNLYKNIVKAFKVKFPDQKEAYQKLKDMMFGLIDRQTQNEFYRRLLRNFFIKDI